MNTIAPTPHLIAQLQLQALNPERAKRNQELAALCTFATLLPEVAFVVSASRFERNALRRDYTGSHVWDAVPQSLAYKVGELDGMPVTVSLSFDAIDGQLVMFYEASSIVVDHRMVDHWLHKAVPALQTTSRICDASNFRNCMQCIHALNEAASRDMAAA